MAESQDVASTKEHNSKFDHVMLVEVDFIWCGLCRGFVGNFELSLFPNNLPEVLAGFHTWWAGSVSIAVEKRSRDTNEFVDLTPISNDLWYLLVALRL